MTIYCSWRKSNCNQVAVEVRSFRQLVGILTNRPLKNICFGGVSDGSNELLAYFHSPLWLTGLKVPIDEPTKLTGLHCVYRPTVNK